MNLKVSDLQKILGQAAKDDGSRRFHSLYDKICRKDVLWAAWLEVLANDGSGGVDGKELDDYSCPEARNALLREIHRELLTGEYRPQAVLRVYIDKPDGGQRPLGIPTIKDRIVQTAAKLILEPIFEADFHDFSYGFRPGKSCHHALQAVWKWMNFGYVHVVDADIRKYFDAIPHDKLLRSVAGRVQDGRVLRLLKQWLQAPVNENGIMIKSRQGSPQGGVISPLLANIYLHHLDHFWVKKGYARSAKLVRYADDFVLLCRERPEFYLKEAQRLLTNLELELNADKTHVVDARKQRFNFLGFSFRRLWVFRPKHRRFGWITGVGVSRKALKKAREQVNRFVGQGGRKSPIPLQWFVSRINQWLAHWLPYYCFSNRRQDFQYVYLKIVLERLVRAKVARSSGIKRRVGKWKSWNPAYWERKYGLMNVVRVY